MEQDWVLLTGDFLAEIGGLQMEKIKLVHKVIISFLGQIHVVHFLRSLPFLSTPLPVLKTLPYNPPPHDKEKINTTLLIIKNKTSNKVLTYNRCPSTRSSPWVIVLQIFQVLKFMTKWQVPSNLFRILIFYIY